jgi:hypothetical protein
VREAGVGAGDRDLIGRGSPSGHTTPSTSSSSSGSWWVVALPPGDERAIGWWCQAPLWASDLRDLGEIKGFGIWLRNRQMRAKQHCPFSADPIVILLWNCISLSVPG